MSEESLKEHVDQQKHVLNKLIGQNIVQGLANQIHSNKEVLQNQYHSEPNLNLPIFVDSFQQQNQSMDENNHNDSYSATIYHSPYLLKNCINPEAQIHQKKKNLNRIDTMNKSVKQIMRCNQEYRGQLLSAYQNKTKMQLQNTILMKEIENLEDEKETILLELQQHQKRAQILENSMQRMKENHKATTDKLKSEIDSLHTQLANLRNTKYDLENKSNQNKLFLQKNQENQAKIKQLEQKIQKISTQKLHIADNYQIILQKYNQSNIEKNRYNLINVEVKSNHSKLQNQMKKTQQQNEKLSNAYKRIEWQYQSLLKEHNYEKRRVETLISKLDSIERDNCELSNELASTKQLHNQLVRTFIDIKAQNERLKAVKLEVEALNKINQSLLQNIKKKQADLQQLNESYIQKSQQLQREKLQNSTLLYQIQVSDSRNYVESNHFIRNHEIQLTSLSKNYEVQLLSLREINQRLKHQNDWLKVALIKKDETISDKQREINRRIEENIESQGKIDRFSIEKSQTDQKLKASMLKIEELQKVKSSNQRKINELQAKNVQIITREAKMTAQKDTLIEALKKCLTENVQNHQSQLQRIVLQQQSRKIAFEQKIQSLEASLKQSNKKNAELQHKIHAQSLIINSMNQTVEERIADIQVKNKQITYHAHQNKTIKQVVQNLREQIERIRSQYKTLQNNHIKLLKQKTQLIKKVQEQRQDHNRQQCQLRQKYEERIKQQTSQIFKTKIHLSNEAKLHQNELTVLQEKITRLKDQNRKYKIASDFLEGIHKQVQVLQETQRILEEDPKISISRFSTHVTALHRQAFTRQVQKIKNFCSIINQCGLQIKKTCEILKLNINLLNRNLQFTFSELQSPIKSKSDRNL